MASELVAVVLLIALFVAMVVGVVSYNRKRDTCPKCGEASKPDIPRESDSYAPGSTTPGLPGTNKPLII